MRTLKNSLLGEFFNFYVSIVEKINLSKIPIYEYIMEFLSMLGNFCKFKCITKISDIS